MRGVMAEAVPVKPLAASALAARAAVPAAVPVRASRAAVRAAPGLMYMVA
jgi:hypothetical protein